MEHYDEVVELKNRPSQSNPSKSNNNGKMSSPDKNASKTNHEGGPAIMVINANPVTTDVVPAFEKIEVCTPKKKKTHTIYAMMYIYIIDYTFYQMLIVLFFKDKRSTNKKNI